MVLRPHDTENRLHLEGKDVKWDLGQNSAHLSNFT